MSEESPPGTLMWGQAGGLIRGRQAGAPPPLEPCTRNAEVTRGRVCADPERGLWVQGGDTGPCVC